MTHTMLLALQITLVGMGLVFASIGALWLAFAVLTRLTADREPEPDQPTDSSAEASARRRKAALAAVAVALATEQASGAMAFPLPPTAGVSAWQAVMRAAQLQQRGPVR